MYYPDDYYDMEAYTPSLRPPWPYDSWEELGDAHAIAQRRRDEARDYSAGKASVDALRASRKPVYSAPRKRVFLALAAHDQSELASALEAFIVHRELTRLGMT